jgi:hypothetical protein
LEECDGKKPGWPPVLALLGECRVRNGDRIRDDSCSATVTFASGPGLSCATGTWDSFHGDIANVSIYVDTLPGLLCSVNSSSGVVNINNTANFLIGWANPAEHWSTFIGDIANVSIYVDSLPGETVCNVNATGYFGGSSSVISACYDVVGICSPVNANAPGFSAQQCCAIEGCTDCATDHSCNVNFTSPLIGLILQSTETSTSVETLSSTSTETTTIHSRLRKVQCHLRLRWGRPRQQHLQPCHHQDHLALL